MESFVEEVVVKSLMPADIKFLITSEPALCDKKIMSLYQNLVEFEKY